MQCAERIAWNSNPELVPQTSAPTFDILEILLKFALQESACPLHLAETATTGKFQAVEPIGQSDDELQYGTKVPRFETAWASEVT
jgi:hypothetical protein